MHPEEFRKDVVEFYKTHSESKTVEFFGVSKYSLHKWCKKYGYKKRLAQKIKDDLKFEILEYADMHGTKSGRFSALNRAEFKGMQRYSKEFKRDLLEFYKTHTAKETAEMFGIDGIAVKNIMARQGFKKLRKFTDEQKLEILEYAEACGVSSAVLNFPGVVAMEIYRWRYNWESSGNFHEYQRVKFKCSARSDELRRDAVEYSQTHSYRETCEYFGIASESLSVWRAKAGVGKKMLWPNELKFEILEYADKHGAKAAAEKYTVSINNIYIWRQNFKRRSEFSFSPAREDG